MLALEVPEGQRLFSTGSGGAPGMSDTQLPISLADGQSAQVFFSYKVIGNALVSHGCTQKIKLTPICETRSGPSIKESCGRLTRSSYCGCETASEARGRAPGLGAATHRGKACDGS